MAMLRKELERLYPVLENNPGLQDRLVTTGYLSPHLAARYGAIGYLGKASGQDFDLRRDCPYAPYDRFKIVSPLFIEGDVSARVRVRAMEILASLDLITALVKGLEAGPVRSPWLFAGAKEAEGIGAVESFRGEILTYVRFNEYGQIARFFPRDPSWFYWPCLEHLAQGNIVPDFPVCNKSVNGSYSGHDL